MAGREALWGLLVLLIAAFITATCGHRLTPGTKSASTAKSSRGREFIIAFTENYGFPVTLTLQLSSYSEPSVVWITVPSPNYNKTVHLAKDSTAEVALTTDFMLIEGEKSKKLVTVSSDEEISVFAFNTAASTSDATACLPKQDLGTEYVVFTSGQGQSNQFAVGNGEDQVTQVNVTVSGSLVFNGITYTDKQTFSITLGNQQVILLSSSSDLTGTRVTSSTPVAVFCGNKCYSSPVGACDVQFEQLYPVQSWGQRFVAFPLMTKSSKDKIRIIPAWSDTTVEVLHNGRTTELFFQPGSSTWLELEGAMLVNSTKPIMIGYLFQGSASPLVSTYDPFSTTVPPIGFSSKYYKFVTHIFYYSYLFIVSRSSSASEFLLDHRPLSGNVVATHHLDGFTGFQVELGKTGGQHEIEHSSEAFAIYVYGVERDISYGYSMGQGGPFSEPEEPPQLVCLAHQAEYRLPMSLVTDADLSIDDIHLNSPECGAQVEGQWAVISVPFDSCGSKVMVEDGKTVYMNTIYGSVPNTTLHRIEVPLRCEMVDNETLGFQFHPMVTDKVAVGHHNLSLGLFKSEAFNNRITTYPFEIDLHGNLYAEFKVESDDENLQILVEDCHASTALSPGETSYTFIKHGCPQDTTLHAYPSGDQRVQHYGFHVFKFGDSPEVYLLCDIVICHNGSSPNRCTQGCSTGRHKRELGGHLQTARLSQGPIIFKPDGGLSVEGYREEQTVSLNGMFVGALCGVGLLATLALIVQRRYYKRQSQGYMILQSDKE